MRGRIAVLVVSGLVLATGTLAAQTWTRGDQEWCDQGWGDRDSDHFCEVRATTIAAVGSLDVNGGTNGGIQVEAWDRNEIGIEARVSARARSEDRAHDLAGDVDIQVSRGRIRADGPDTRRREGWSVSFRIKVPRNTDLSLRTTNGGIGVTDVSGAIDFRATNGGVHLAGVSGDVRGRTTNGGLHVELAGDRWSGQGMDVETTNGGVTVAVPADYSAELVTGTTNGGIDIDFPVTVRGRIGRQLRTTLGEGGPTVRAVTTNGGVKIVRR